MREELSRTELLIGNDSLIRLNNAKVAVFGIGGVGGYAVEALVRGGIGSFVLIDNDIICASNINRQIIATTKTIGRYKTEVMKERILDINPNAYVETYECFFLPENSGKFDFSEYDYVVDAVDTVTAKIEIVMCAQEAGVPVISSMGTGNKLDFYRKIFKGVYASARSFAVYRRLFDLYNAFDCGFGSAVVWHVVNSCLVLRAAVRSLTVFLRGIDYIKICKKNGINGDFKRVVLYAYRFTKACASAADGFVIGVICVRAVSVAACDFFDAAK